MASINLNLIFVIIRIKEETHKIRDLQSLSLGATFRKESLETTVLDSIILVQYSFSPFFVHSDCCSARLPI